MMIDVLRHTGKSENVASSALLNDENRGTTVFVRGSSAGKETLLPKTRDLRLTHLHGTPTCTWSLFAALRNRIAHESSFDKKEALGDVEGRRRRRRRRGGGVNRMAVVESSLYLRRFANIGKGGNTHALKRKQEVCRGGLHRRARKNKEEREG